jgi:hypothetical protein
MPNSGIVTSGLTMMLDGANPASLVSGSQYFYDLTGNNNHATMSSPYYVEDYGGSAYLNDNWSAYNSLQLPIDCNNLMLTSSFSMFFSFRRDFLGNREEYSSRAGENGGTMILKAVGDFPFTTGWGLYLSKQYANSAFGGGKPIDPSEDNLELALNIFNRGYLGFRVQGPEHFVGISVSGSQLTLFHNGEYRTGTKSGYVPGVNNARIGQTYFGNSGINSLNGPLNTCFLYNRPLSVDEFQQNYEFLKSRTLNSINTTVTSSQLDPIQEPILLYNALTASSYPGSGSIWYNISPFTGSNLTLLTGSVPLSGSIVFNISQSARNNGGQIPYAHLDRSISVWAKTPTFQVDPGQSYAQANTLYGFFRNQYNENVEVQTVTNLGNGDGLITTAGAEYSNDAPYTTYEYPVKTNQWYNYVFVGDYQNRIKKLYINGEKVDEFSSDVNPIRNGARLSLANTLTSGKNYWKGEISNFTTYNRVLSDLEISQSYESLKANFPGTEKPKPPVPKGLIVHLDAANSSSYAGSGSTWYDLSGYGNHAIFTASTGSFLPDKGGTLSFDSNQCSLKLFSGSLDYRLGTNDAVTLEMIINILECSEAVLFSFSPYSYLYYSGGVFVLVNYSQLTYFVKGSGTSQPQSVQSLSNIPLTAGYQHIVLIITSNTLNESKLYVNGELYFLDTRSNRQITFRQHTGLKRFGAGLWGINGSPAYGAGASFNLNLFKAYNKELTAVEVSQSFSTYANRIDPAPSVDTPVLPPTDNPVMLLDISNPLCYPGSGSRVSDLSGYGQLAVAYSCSYTSSAGGALVLTSGSVRGSSVNINPTFQGNYTLENIENLSVEMWVRSPLINESMMLGFIAYSVYNNSNGFGFNTDNGDVYGISAATLNSLDVKNNWAQYVFVVNSKAVTNNKIFINGIEQTLSQIQGTPQPGNISIPAGFCRIGGRYLSYTYKIPMEIGLFKMYNKAITQQQVTDSFNTNRSRFGI